MNNEEQVVKPDEAAEAMKQVNEMLNAVDANKINGTVYRVVRFIMGRRPQMPAFEFATANEGYRRHRWIVATNELNTKVASMLGLELRKQR